MSVRKSCVIEVFGGVCFLSRSFLDFSLGVAGPCKVRNETETKRNETDRNETKQIEMKRNRSKRNETNRNETKQNETKQIETKRNELYGTQTWNILK